ncbi:MAG TPA: single-stranded DNA-binding protein [Jiangellaceae bacterium]
MSDAFITLIGNIASEIRSINTQRGTAITSFRFAHTPRRIDRQTGRWGDGPTSFFGVTCWRGLAEHVSASLHKGDPVVLYGRLRVRDWKNDDGRSGRDAEIDAISIGHDLTRGTSEFTRVTRDRSDQVDESELAASMRIDLLVEEQADAAGEAPGGGADPVYPAAASGHDRAA